MNEEKVPRNISAFPVGEPNAQYARFFVGRSYLAPLTGNADLNCPIANVTFEPACRNNWHSHSGGQILIAVGGKGYYQERGKRARLLLAGDVVEIAPKVEHWHGAAPDSWFSHLAVECNPRTNGNTWLEPVDDAAYAEAVSQGRGAAGSADPELDEIFGRFVGETQRYGDLDMRTRMLITMASAVATGSEAEYRRTAEAALAGGVPPEEVKEVLYHAVPYAGMAKVRGLLETADGILAAHGAALPLERRNTVTGDTRMAEGLALQKSIFGDGIDAARMAAPENQRHMQDFLSANCFGDYQTRRVFDTKMRELLTFSILISLGGCEPQVKAHIGGNMNVGNGKAVLLAAVTQLLPYIGYPRALNAVACLNEAIPEND